ncbi:hypothetical protein HZS_4249, partial [Henneguya salminicola]
MMQILQQPAFIILSQPSSIDIWSDQKLKYELEEGDISKKLEALENMIFSVANGQMLSKDLLIYVIRFLIPVQDKKLKKMLLLFWELIPKYQSDGKMITEMILVCDAYRKDLQHPNEYIRGSILRFLCKLKEHQILEPIMPAIRSCLEHKSAYVRRNAVLSIFTIYKNFDYLIPDAPALIENFLEIETDSSCKRNAYMMLIQADQQERAINYLKNKAASVLSYGDVLQLAIIELIYNYSVQSHEKNIYLKYLYELLTADSRAVQFAAANTLLSLSDSPTAFEFASKCYVNLILKESDNNVRLIVLDRISYIHSLKKYDWTLYDVSLDLLCVLSAGAADSIIDLELARRILRLVTSLLSPDHTEPAVNFFRKEILRIQKLISPSFDSKKLSGANKDIVAYNRLLIKSIKTLCDRHQHIPTLILPFLLNGLISAHALVSCEILDLVRSIVCSRPETRACIFQSLLSVISLLNDSNAFRSALWILASSISTVDQIEKLISTLSSLIDTNSSVTGVKSQTEQKNTDILIAPDGSYLTQPSYISTQKSTAVETFVLNSFISDGCTYICSSLATILLKLVSIYKNMCPNNSEVANLITAKCLNILIKIIQLYTEKYDNKNDNIDIQRIFCVINLLTKGLNSEILKTFLDTCDTSFYDYINFAKEKNEEVLEICTLNEPPKNIEWGVSFSSIIVSIQEKKKENIFNKSLLAATGKLEQPIENISDKIIPLTGLSDPIYAESYIKISNFDIYFDMLIVNQTNDYLENIVLELRTQGECSILNKTPPLVLSKLKFGNIQTCLRVASSDSNIIFGTITYNTGATQRDTISVVLDEIRLDLIEYIQDWKCLPDDFHKMWMDFEWENKVSVSVKLTDFKELITAVIDKTHMILVSQDDYQSDCKFMVVNLYCKNRFGDEALANLSLEKQNDPSGVVGQVRIRAKTQSMAINI